ncbi:MAG TPA: hypothetical protein DD670_01490 [Planctomycetaceae bacterium]|nr:hypothetical protein [Planctomycetaceae bacterium]
MNDYRLLNPGDEQTARDLRLRIGRTRRRIDARTRAATDEGRRLASWRTYVARYTGSSMAVAFGVGLALAAGLSGTRLLRWIALRSIRQGMRGVGGALVGELSRFWRESSRAASAAKENVDG